jgi:hypothetical protein
MLRVVVPGRFKHIHPPGQNANLRIAFTSLACFGGEEIGAAGVTYHVLQSVRPTTAANSAIPAANSI